MNNEPIQPIDPNQPKQEPESTWPDKCRRCGQTKEEPFFSRIIPMGYFCGRCGCPWTEQEGVE